MVVAWALSARVIWLSWAWEVLVWLAVVVWVIVVVRTPAMHVDVVVIGAARVVAAPVVGVMAVGVGMVARHSPYPVGCQVAAVAIAQEVGSAIYMSIR